MAIRNSPPHYLRPPRGEASIAIAVPKANRPPKFSHRKPPGRSKQLRIRQYAYGRRFPSAALTLETSLKSQFVTQRIGIAWLKQFQEPGAAAPGRSERKKRPGQTKSEATKRSWESFVG